MRFVFAFKDYLKSSLNRLDIKIQLTTFSVLLLIALKLALSGLAPIVGDEAYYIYWGLHFSGGYYDHPPMVGWLEAIFSSFSTASVLLRLPSILTMMAVAFFMYKLLAKHVSQRTAYLISSLWFFSPLPFLDIFVSPDIPLLLFSFISSALFFEAIDALQRLKNKNAFLLFLLAGVFFGGGFLSKYFIVFLAPSFLIYYFYSKGLRALWPLATFLLGMLPFVLQHLYWNASHGWASLYFLFSRKSDFNKDVLVAFSSLVASLAFHVTPVWWGPLLLNRSEMKLQSSCLRNYAGLMWMIPSFFFTISALLGKGQGLHWYFFITPYFFIWMGLRFSESTLALYRVQMICLTLLSYLILCIILVSPPNILTKKLLTKTGLSAHLSLNQNEFFSQLSEYLNKVDLVVFGSYSDASTLELELMRYHKKNRETIVPLVVPERNGRYGRVFDFIVNYNSFNGKNILFIFKKLKNDLEAEQMKNSIIHYFKRVQLDKKTINFKGHLTSYYVLEGYNFNAKKYIKYEVQPKIKKYYWNGCSSKFLKNYCDEYNYT